MGRRRHLARVLALQVLYANEYLADDPADIVRRLTETGKVSKKNWNEFCRELLQRTIDQESELDASIKESLKNWRLERLSMVDHLILRLALCEMRSFDDIPIRVTLNEYIELAKQFSAEESSSFVNGILDHLAKQFSQKDFQSEKPPKRNQ